MAANLVGRVCVIGSGCVPYCTQLVEKSRVHEEDCVSWLFLECRHLRPKGDLGF